MENINYSKETNNKETINIIDNNKNNDISITNSDTEQPVKIKIKKLKNSKVPFNDLNLLVNSKKINNPNINSDSESDINIDEELENEIDDVNNINILSDSNNSNIKINNNLDDDNNNDLDDDNNNDLDDDNNDLDDDNNDLDDNSYEDEDEDEDDDDDKEPELSYEDIQKMKSELIYKLNRLEKSGYKASRKYSMASNLDDIKFEYDTIKRQRDIDKSIKFSRKMLLACISGIEFLNNKFDYMDLKLDGWSEQTMESVGDYDEVFEELHDKYNEKVKMAPELKLLMMVAGSGFMFHLTQSLFKSSTPEVNDILRQNPDIMQSISQAAMNNMSQQFQQTTDNKDPIMNMMMGGIKNNIEKIDINKKTNLNKENNSIDNILDQLDNDDNIMKNIKVNNRTKKKKGIDLDI